MVVDVYADLLFFLNAGMDALCFGLTARMLHRPLSRPRLVGGAVLGGLYAVISLFADLTRLPHGRVWAVLLDVAVCLLLCALVFGRRGESPRRVLWAAAMFAVVSMVMGGVMTALYHLLNRLDLPFLSSGGDGGSSMSAILFALLAGAGALISARSGGVFRQSGAVTACGITVTVDGHTVTLDGMVDSGNLLRDPVGGKPVIVLDRRAAAPLLSPALAALVDAGGTHMGGGLSPAEQRRVRLIPTGTAMGSGLLVALVPDKLILTPEGGAPREVDALVALTDLGTAPAAAMIPAELLAHA